MKNISKTKNLASKNNLEKNEDTALPMIPNPSNNFSNGMDSYKRTFYGKKNSNNFNLTIFQQGKKKI